MFHHVINIKSATMNCWSLISYPTCVFSHFCTWNIIFLKYTSLFQNGECDIFWCVLTWWLLFADVFPVGISKFLYKAYFKFPWLNFNFKPNLSLAFSHDCNFIWISCGIITLVLHLLLHLEKPPGSAHTSKKGKWWLPQRMKACQFWLSPATWVHSYFFSHSNKKPKSTRGSGSEDPDACPLAKRAHTGRVNLAAFFQFIDSFTSNSRCYVTI